MATIRKRKNSIWKIKEEYGNWFEDQEGISRSL